MTQSNKHGDGYDRGINPAETAAREEREKEDFKKPIDQDGDFDTSEGTTVDREGLANNYAIEPEMYVEEPGDLREKQQAEEAERAKELEEINEPGGKGPGIV